MDPKPTPTLSDTVIINTPRGRAAAIVTGVHSDGKLDLAILFPGEASIFPMVGVERAKSPITPGWMPRIIEAAEPPAPAPRTPLSGLPPARTEQPK